MEFNYFCFKGHANRHRLRKLKKKILKSHENSLKSQQLMLYSTITQTNRANALNHMLHNLSLNFVCF